MSDYLPFEIQITIIKKLPIRALIQFRSVSKSWKSLIDSSDFIANYHFSNAPLQHHVLVRSFDSEHEKYVSIVDDDDNFPQNKIPLIVPSHVRLQLGKFPDIIGSSQGVLFLWFTPSEFVLWNPTIRKTVPIVVPNLLNNNEFETVVGFGVCPGTSDPKLVKITYISSLQFKPEKCIPLQVELFNLSSGSWRSLSMNVPRKSIEVTWKQVCIDKFIYWLAGDRNLAGNTLQTKYLILSFDMITEEFTEIDLPDNLAYLHNDFLLIYKLWTSLLVLDTEFYEIQEYCVWKMDLGVPNTFAKLFVIKSPFESLLLSTVHDFRITGQPIIEMFINNDDKQHAFYVYEPASQEICDIGITGGYPCLANHTLQHCFCLIYRGVEDQDIVIVLKCKCNAKNTQLTP
ncbi:putative F-box protein At3g51171 [Rutidosis leptorrhynchoides]|uniref:putative F-box protein At3g51171 n=1 Tax=Rutidosis leptorrhynchoides TaxID=125765 RepID=UPI003A98E8B4